MKQAISLLGAIMTLLFALFYGEVWSILFQIHMIHSEGFAHGC